MAFSSCVCTVLVPHKSTVGHWQNRGLRQEIAHFPRREVMELRSHRVARVDIELLKESSFIGGTRVVIRPRVSRSVPSRRGLVTHASWLSGPQLASNVFTMGTASVLPFYTLMVFAPKARLTKKFMESSIPYAVLGLLYAYLLCLSWTPETLRLMFSSQYWLPELPGIVKMFSSEMTLASAWIHLMAVDLYAARQVFHDGMENKIETRHSVSLCLLFCPIGILTHVVTKALTQNSRNTKNR